MTVRSLLPVAGQRLKVRWVAGYGLPAALSEGEEVTFLSHDCGTCVVRKDDGSEIQISRCCLAEECLYEITPGEWAPEHDPRVQEVFRRWRENPRYLGNPYWPAPPNDS